MAGVLKLYFRGLENPLFPKERFNDLISCVRKYLWRCMLMCLTSSFVQSLLPPLPISAFSICYTWSNNSWPLLLSWEHLALFVFSLGLVFLTAEIWNQLLFFFSPLPQGSRTCTRGRSVSAKSCWASPGQLWWWCATCSPSSTSESASEDSLAINHRVHRYVVTTHVLQSLSRWSEHLKCCWIHTRSLSDRLRELLLM